ncbi:MAG: MEKHLA domain-containing protein [Cellvibrionales bacterium]|nr:MEKHLA domain-containing protein [Cellvibrionales bacterium]
MPPHLNTAFYQQHAINLCYSYQQLLNKPLIQMSHKGTLINQLFNAPFALLSHGLEDDPIFNFGNQAALSLFEYNWDTFTQLPSRLSAKPIDQVERQRLLDAVSQHGYIDNYAGIRIAASGREFLIENAVVWNVIDKNGSYCGQAAVI